MTAGRESRLALFIAIGCFLAGFSTAVVNTAQAVDEESLTVRTKAIAESREALLRRVEERVASLKRIGDPPLAGPGALDTGISVLHVQTAEFSWNMEVEGAAGPIGRIIGPNVRAARITQGSTSGTLRAELAYDSPSLPRALFTPERVAAWVSGVEDE